MQRIHKILDRLYPTPAPPLIHSDAFTLLVAVVLSAQTTDVQVNKVTPALFERAPDAFAMAKLSQSAVLSYIKTCGLAPRKSKALVELSSILVHDHEGRVPNNYPDLESLPGVGHKTACVVMSQAFGKSAFPVDTHIHRLASRWGLSNGRNVEQTERDLKRLFPKDAWSRLHLQIIYFGRERCPARGHDLARCEICGWAATKKRIAQEANNQGS